jgi:SAM-dependent methyltransferase
MPFLAASAKGDGVGSTIVDQRANVETLQRMGIEACCQDLAALAGEARFTVISMADVFEHMPFPRQGLTAAHRLLARGGILLVSMPNYNCAAWRLLDGANGNPYWGELKHLHNFSRKRLYALLRRYTGASAVSSDSRRSSLRNITVGFNRRGIRFNSCQPACVSNARTGPKGLSRSRAKAARDAGMDCGHSYRSRAEWGLPTRRR